MNTPTKIWICVAGKDAPDWIIERMTTTEIAADGSFEIEAADGLVRVEAGFAVFAFGDQVFACPPRMVQDKLSTAVGADNEVVAKLTQRSEARREQKAASRDAARAAPLAKAKGEKALKCKPMIGSPPTPANCLLDNLFVDNTYQRSIEGGASQALIVKIAENWDWRLCLPLIGSKRQGKIYVIDGQHRLEAARLRGDIRDLPVVVFDLDDQRAEAELFVQANRSRRAMGQLDDFHAAVVAGDAKAGLINDVVTGAGLTVGRIQAWQYWKPGEVVFVTAIQRALNAQGRTIVENALGMIARAFDGVVLTGGGALFTGLCHFIQQRDKAGNPISFELMETVLAETGIAGWKEAVETANSGQERAEGMLRALTDAYNEAEGVE